MRNKSNDTNVLRDTVTLSATSEDEAHVVRRAGAATGGIVKRAAPRREPGLLVHHRSTLRQWVLVVRTRRRSCCDKGVMRPDSNAWHKYVSMAITPSRYVFFRPYGLYLPSRIDRTRQSDVVAGRTSFDE